MTDIKLRRRHPLREARRAAAQFRAGNPHLKRTDDPRLTARYWRNA